MTETTEKPGAQAEEKTETFRFKRPHRHRGEDYDENSDPIKVTKTDLENLKAHQADKPLSTPKKDGK